MKEWPRPVALCPHPFYRLPRQATTLCDIVLLISVAHPDPDNIDIKLPNPLPPTPILLYLTAQHLAQCQEASPVSEGEILSQQHLQTFPRNTQIFSPSDCNSGAPWGALWPVGLSLRGPLCPGPHARQGRTLPPWHLLLHRASGQPAVKSAVGGHGV